MHGPACVFGPTEYLSRGRDLAAALPPECAAAGLVVTSPLTRALQTALLLFGGTTIPILVHPAVAVAVGRGAIQTRLCIFY
jgi:hypothetical protein